MKHSTVLSRRPRSNAAERAQWAQRFRQSGLSRQEFASRYGLGLSTLHRWLQKAEVLRPAFAELKLSAATARWAAEVVHPDGLVVRLAHDVPSSLLKQLLPAC